MLYNWPKTAKHLTLFYNTKLNLRSSPAPQLAHAAHHKPITQSAVLCAWPALLNACFDIAQRLLLDTLLARAVVNFLRFFTAVRHNGPTPQGAAYSNPCPYTHHCSQSSRALATCLAPPKNLACQPHLCHPLPDTLAIHPPRSHTSCFSAHLCSQTWNARPPQPVTAPAPAHR